MDNENPGVDFKSVFGDGNGFSVAREMTPEELASAKPCPGDSVFAKHPSICGCLDDASQDLGVVLISDEMIGLDEKGRPTPPPGFGYPDDAEDFGLTNEEFEAAVRKASEMSNRALKSAAATLHAASGAAVAGAETQAHQLMMIHDRWLRFAEVVAP